MALETLLSGHDARVQDAARYVYGVWETLCAGKDEDAVATIGESIVGAYLDPRRHYHDIRHIEHSLQQWELVYDLLENSAAVGLAIIEHDEEYHIIPEEKSNEVQSAERFARNMTVLEFDDTIIVPGKRLVEVTEIGVEPRTSDEKYMSDIDFSTLGRPWEEFLAYRELIWKEYAGVVNRTEFDMQTEWFYRMMLAQDTIFYTDFYAHLEEQARKNLADGIQLIRTTLQW